MSVTRRGIIKSLAALAAAKTSVIAPSASAGQKLIPWTS